MGRMQFSDPQKAVGWAFSVLRYHGVEVDPGRWQGVPTKGKPDLMTREALDLDIAFPIAYTMEQAQQELQPNLPWAEDHFRERVGRKPTNPGYEYQNWPWWHGQDTKAMEQVNQTSRDDYDLIFSHTYQERFWPKFAGWADSKGIRYELGDLDDVVNQLYTDPQTRQAYLPIFFPEDTGAVHGGRVPCTLGYHFMLRKNMLHCWYDIRSCDAVRHFRDDLYLAVRLVQWVIAELVEKEIRGKSEQVWVDVNPGTLFFRAHSFHVHMGDFHLLP